MNDCFGKRQILHEGKCKVEVSEKGREIIVIQDGEKHNYFGYEISKNEKFIVVWQRSLNYHKDKNKQVCLIEKKKKVLWCEIFEVVQGCHVSNNGLVVALFYELIPAKSANGMPGFLSKYKIAIIDKHKKTRFLEFNEKQEIMAFSSSEDGRYLVYYIQKYHPTSYKLILYDIKKSEVKWSVDSSKTEVVHELNMTNNNVHVYAGPRPSAYVDRTYSYSLTLDGNRVTDNNELKKRNQENNLDKTKNELMDEIGSLLKKSLESIVPTIEVTKKIKVGIKETSKIWTEVMSGKHQLPAIIIDLVPVPAEQKFSSSSKRLSMSQSKTQGYRFFIHLTIIAENAESRGLVVNDCIQTLTKNERALSNQRLSFENRLRSENIGFYPGSGKYYRSRISSIVIFPSQKNDAEVLNVKTWKQTIELKPDESIVLKNEAYFRSPIGRINAKLVITTKRLVILMENSISMKFKKIDIFPEKAKDIIFRSDTDGDYIVRLSKLSNPDEESRIYFKADNKDEVISFKKELESLRGNKQ